MSSGVRTCARGARAMIARASVKWPRAFAASGAQAAAMRASETACRRLDRDDSGGRQRLARKIETADLRVLIDVAQDVRQLQRASQMVGERETGVFLHAEDRTERRPTALATRSQ